MKKEYFFCDLCGKQLLEHTKIHGICTVMGFSKNGWGRRENALAMTKEVCKDCFEKYKKACMNFVEELQLKDTKGGFLIFKDLTKKENEELRNNLWRERCNHA